MKILRLDPGQITAVLALGLVLSTAFPASSELPPPSAAMSHRHKQPGPELIAVIFDHVRRGDAEALKLYLDSGYTPNAVNARGDSLLVLSAYKGHAELVKLLLRQPGVAVDFKNKMGFTALTGAAFKGETEIMEHLIAAGADVNQRNASGQTALMFAALTGRFSAVKLLLQHRAEAKARDAAGNSAASLAEMQGAAEVVRVLR